ncbi:AT-hook motif nuclear-localized protein 15-29 [Dioscorea alata]|uniref:AT-hook motif nuclear-localized protein 15-29 n=1 Tax=Dioscorea alata TaxID=55571 RepID=A0ACB7VXV0_DIOAL|nr:AT-hook motif nuclear-localized protein 15-29 [Dioscorea alata]
MKTHHSEHHQMITMNVEAKPAGGGGGGGGGDGSSIEIVRRPRGRPPGSKNKPKPPVIITRDADPPTSMRAHVIEISAGHDLVEAIADFSRRRDIGVCVLAGSGAVSNVTLRQPPPPTLQPPPVGPAATVVFRGRFEILSFSATVFPPATPALPAPALSVSLAGPHGQIVGGIVAGPLMAAGTVVLVAAGFSNPTFHRLPPDTDEVPVTAVGTAVVNSPETCGGMSIYNSHVGSDVIWAPAPRAPPPPPF